MHELSLGTWFIHMATLIEWTVAIFVISLIGKKKKKRSLYFLSLAMIPNLISALAAITWHIFDNADSLSGLVVFQAITTVIGNTTLAFAAWNLSRENPIGT